MWRVLRLVRLKRRERAKEFPESEKPMRPGCGALVLDAKLDASSGGVSEPELVVVAGWDVLSLLCILL